MLQRKTYKLRIYISLKFWSGQLTNKRFPPEKKAKEDDFALLFRIMCRYYLQHLHLHYVFNVLKVQRESKRFHVKGVTQMLNVFKQEMV